MAQLSPDQLRFLATQRIPLSMVFDATGLQKRDYAAAMDELGAYFAYGVTPCAAGGHQLRTKAGHCIQCDTSKIAYATRHSSGGTVYLAASTSTGLVKVGMSKDLNDRLQKLQEYRYGGASDWKIICSARLPEAGRIEFAIQERLAPFRKEATYRRADRDQRCYELFACDTAVAEEAVAAIAPPGTVTWTGR